MVCEYVTVCLHIWGKACLYGLFTILEACFNGKVLGKIQVLLYLNDVYFVRCIPVLSPLRNAFTDSTTAGDGLPMEGSLSSDDARAAAALSTGRAFILSQRDTPRRAFAAAPARPSPVADVQRKEPQAPESQCQTPGC